MGQEGRPRERELDLFIVLLSGIAGWTDASAYVALGKLFVAHMSGNSASAAVHLAGGEVGLALHRLFPVASFVGALIVGSLVAAALVRRSARRVHAVLLGTEAVLLAASVMTSLVVSRFVADRVAVVLTTAAMAMQNVAVGHLAGVPTRTTAITGVLTQLAEHAVVPSRHRRALVFAGMWVAFFGAGLAGAVTAMHVRLTALLVPAAVLGVLALRDAVRPLRTSEPELQS